MPQSLCLGNLQIYAQHFRATTLPTRTRVIYQLARILALLLALFAIGKSGKKKQKRASDSYTMKIIAKFYYTDLAKMDHIHRFE